jgi:hypothetical protein
MVGIRENKCYTTMYSGIKGVKYVIGVNPSRYSRSDSYVVKAAVMSA